MKIVCLNPQTDLRWRQLVEGQYSDVFHSPEWMGVLSETYGFEVQAWVILDNEGTPQAGIPFCRVTDLRGERIVTLPFSDYCDPLVSNEEQWDALANHLLRENYPVTIRCLHNNLPLVDKRLTEVNKAKWHSVDLEPPLDLIWQGFKDSGRRAIRKARQTGIEVRLAESEEDLRAFYELHLKLRKYKYRLLAQPYRFFERIWSHFLEKQKGALMLAVQNGQIISGIIFLHWKDTFYYKFNASSVDYLSNRPNDFLLWEGIQLAKAKGSMRLDFGLSDWDQDGLLQYKRKFATQEKKISFLRYSPKVKVDDSGAQFGALLPKLTDLFTEDNVPDTVTENAGEILYRYFT